MTQPKQPSPSKSQAIQTALDGDWKNAVHLNKQLVEDDPKDTEALNRLAFAFTILGKVKEAKLTYQKVLKLDSLNPIALRNLKRLAGSSTNHRNTSVPTLSSNMFLEETGKTKVVELINVAQPKIIGNLQTGESLEILVKRSKIFLLQGKQFIGMLPDDIGRRLLKFISGGNKYEAYIKATSANRVVVFLKEIKRANRYKNQPSFLFSPDKSTLSFERPKNKETGGKKDKDYDEEETEEESSY
ncbi:MAG TPA: hypothetical protein VLF68_00035 [Candidatus Saccharimonadales bacterium]|nr:hypothetical protein [Candidatus Saccharimonadales bacterium]